MRTGMARMLAFMAMIEGMIAIPVKLWTDGGLWGISGGGYLTAAMATLLMAIFFLLDDFRDMYRRAHA
ncbi:MAG: hypothetical protein JJD96_07320 [Thermoleophilia bacterium]|nr:hypothetical protein [Thermoleophilia bacterium]